MPSSNPSPEIIIEAFNGEQAIADEVAQIHLGIRRKQQKDGENQFRTGLHTSQADLLAMQDYYIEPGGNFWIARDIATDAITGFVGLKRESDHEGQLKRMAVVPTSRGRHLGLRLACTLIAWAAQQDFEIIRLTTGVNEVARSKVYEPLGFAVYGYDPYHNDHLMELVIET